jgi:hypothetical protein
VGTKDGTLDGDKVNGMETFDGTDEENIVG